MSRIYITNQYTSRRDSYRRHFSAVFLGLFTARFPIKSIEIVSKSFDQELEKFRQDDDSFKIYYQRTYQVIQRYEVRNRLLDGFLLLLIESSLHDLVYSVFLRGRSDSAVRIAVIRDSCIGEKSVHAVYLNTEQVYKSNLLIRQLEYEEIRSLEVSFYKEVVKRNVIESPLQIMWAENSAGKKSVKKRIPSQHLISFPKVIQPSQKKPLKTTLLLRRRSQLPL